MNWVRESDHVFETSDEKYKVRRFQYEAEGIEFFSAIFCGGKGRTLAFSYESADCFWACRKHRLGEWKWKDTQDFRIPNMWARLVSARQERGLPELKPRFDLSPGIPCPRTPEEPVV